MSSVFSISEREVMRFARHPHGRRMLAAMATFPEGEGILGKLLSEKNFFACDRDSRSDLRRLLCGVPLTTKNIKDAIAVGALDVSRLKTAKWSSRCSPEL